MVYLLWSCTLFSSSTPERGKVQTTVGCSTAWRGSYIDRRLSSNIIGTRWYPALFILLFLFSGCGTALKIILFMLLLVIMHRLDPSVDISSIIICWNMFLKISHLYHICSLPHQVITIYYSISFIKRRHAWLMTQIYEYRLSQYSCEADPAYVVEGPYQSRCGCMLPAPLVFDQFCWWDIIIVTITIVTITTYFDPHPCQGSATLSLS